MNSRIADPPPPDSAGRGGENFVTGKQLNEEHF